MACQLSFLSKLSYCKLKYISFLVAFGSSLALFCVFWTKVDMNTTLHLLINFTKGVPLKFIIHYTATISSCKAVQNSRCRHIRVYTNSILAFSIGVVFYIFLPFCYAWSLFVLTFLSHKPHLVVHYSFNRLHYLSPTPHWVVHYRFYRRHYLSSFSLENILFSKSSLRW